jgi:peptide/nickel transport system ATP-binding protein
MYLGKIVEYAGAEQLFKSPLHPYTEALLSAVPIADPTIQMQRIPLEGEIPNPANAPSGCYFHTRCRYCTQDCRERETEFKQMEGDRYVACHRSGELSLKGISISA